MIIRANLKSSCSEKKTIITARAITKVVIVIKDIPRTVAYIFFSSRSANLPPLDFLRDSISPILRCNIISLNNIALLKKPIWRVEILSIIKKLVKTDTAVCKYDAAVKPIASELNIFLKLLISFINFKLG